MDHIRFGIGTFWICITVGATVLLGTEFILHEIHAFIRQRRGRQPE